MENKKIKYPLLVRSPNWLGDAVMATPAVRNLKKLIGKEPLYLVTPPKLQAFWQMCPFVDHVISLSPSRSFYCDKKILRPYEFKTAVLFPNSLHTALEARLSGIKNIIGYQGHFRKFLLSKIVSSKKFRLDRAHQSFRYNDIIESLGGEDDNSLPLLRLPKSPEKKTQVSVCAGAAYGAAKCWPAERFAQVLLQIQKKRKIEIVLLGSDKDTEVSEAIIEKIPQAINLCGKTDMNQFIEHLLKSQLLLCNDSGSMHLASALDVPCVSIFGSTEPLLTGPMGEKSRVIRHKTPCSPCFLRQCPLDFQCMIGVSSEEVFHAALKLLGES